MSFSGSLWGLHPRDNLRRSGACEKVVDPGKYAAAGLQNSRFDEEWEEHGGTTFISGQLFHGKYGKMRIFYGKYGKIVGFSWTFRFIPEISPLVKIVEIDLRRPSKCSACP